MAQHKVIQTPNNQNGFNAIFLDIETNKSTRLHRSQFTGNIVINQIVDLVAITK